MNRRGYFITLEGIDGTGKSTQLRLLAQNLKRCAYKVTTTREPGGTAVGEQIRSILLASSTQRLAPLAELMLMYAARAQHLEEVVRPALARGDLVLSDRFNDASMAYQGFGRKLGAEIVRRLDRIVCGVTQPDLTLVLDIAPRFALARAQRREVRRKSKYGRFEVQGLSFHQRVRRGYLAIARQDPGRVIVIRAGRPVAEVQTDIRNCVDTFLARHGCTPKAKSKSNGKRQMAKVKNEEKN